MRLTVYYEDIPKFEFDKKLYLNWIQQIITCEGKKSGKITIVFCSDKYILDMNRKFLQHDYITDIITFDYSENITLSGDLLIAVNQVKKNARVYRQTFTAELGRVIFHGILHLAGYKDKSGEERAYMKKLEEKYLEKFRLIENEL